MLWETFISPRPEPSPPRPWVESIRDLLCNALVTTPGISRSFRGFLENVSDELFGCGREHQKPGECSISVYTAHANGRKQEGPIETVTAVQTLYKARPAADDSSADDRVSAAYSPSSHLPGFMASVTVIAKPARWVLFGCDGF